MAGIQFIVEVGGKSINFLDLNINISNKFEFAIYRKPTSTDLIILKESNHPKTHKYAAFHAMLKRAQNIPMLSLQSKISDSTFHKNLMYCYNIFILNY